MDACVKANLGKAVWLVTAAAALAVGLNALGMDTLGLIHLYRFDVVLRYIVGICGLMSIVMFFSNCHKSC
jgi:uncharacterized membrane protein YuzA (DUF378 family)